MTEPEFNDRTAIICNKENDSLWNPRYSLDQAFIVLKAICRDPNEHACSYAVLTETNLTQYRCYLSIDYDCMTIAQACTELSDVEAIYLAINSYLSEGLEND